MFCKIKKLFIALIIICLIGFVFYQKNYAYTLSNGEREISTTINNPSLLLFVDIPKSSLSFSQETVVPFYYVAKANDLFKSYGVYAAVIISISQDANEEEIMKSINYLKRYYKIEIDVFIDKKSKFANKIGAKGINTTLLIKNNKIAYSTDNMKIKWFDIDGMKLVSQHLGISIGL